MVTTASCLVPLLRQKFRVYVGGHERDEPKEVRFEIRDSCDSIYLDGSMQIYAVLVF